MAMKHRIENSLIYLEDHKFHKGVIDMEDGIITDIIETEFVPDQETSYVIPGLVDIHFHGCVGADLCDGDVESIRKMADYEASRGVTGICPATMSLPVEELHRIMTAVGAYEETGGAHLVGINMEGPFLSKDKKGAQAEENIIPCDVALFRRLQEEAGGRIKLVDIAPEEKGAMDFIDALKDEVHLSLAHTRADYAISMEAFRRGAGHVTHLCNAMPPLHHRNPGVIGAAADAGAYVELICDGVHIHPAMVRTLFKTFGNEKICLISDSMRATGLGDGEYTLGGQDVFVKGSVATLKDGTIAGSVTNLMDCLRIAVREMGISVEAAVRCATENPARAIGIFDSCGSISVGKRADLVRLDSDLRITGIWIGGEYRSPEIIGTE